MNLKTRLNNELKKVMEKIAVLESIKNQLENELKTIKDNEAGLSCLNCKNELGGKKYHVFKNGSVCHACFMTCQDGYKSWSV
jgi:hypothetical protein